MIRIHIICEGQTEEVFINEVLLEHFSAHNIYLTPSLIGRPGHKGGNFRFERLLQDVRNRLLGDKTAYCTTLFDFYGLPEAFPGKVAAYSQNDYQAKARTIEAALLAELQNKLGNEVMQRFIPYVQMYEFEGLLFSDVHALASGLNQPELINPLQSIRDVFVCPEMINNSPETAPSKRLLKLCESYDKPLHGSLAALEIGLMTIREQCPRFNQWLSQLEQLPKL